MAEARETLSETTESNISPAFQDVLSCCLCLSCLTDPVTISCGHSFCRGCLHLSWEDAPLPVHCPTCREPSQQKDFATDFALKKLVSTARRERLRRDLSSEEHKCGTHGETRAIFCADSRICLCQLCADSHDPGHSHCPVEGAAEAQMERLVNQMARVWDKIRANQENLEATKSTATRWMDYLTLREDMVRTEYRKLHPVVCEGEEDHLWSVRKQGRVAFTKLRDREARLVQKSQELREMCRKLMKKSREPYLVLLQTSEDILGRSESKQLLKMPRTVRPELRALPMVGLKERFSSFEAPIEFSNMTLLPANANLFQVLRRSSLGPRQKATPEESSRCYLHSWADAPSFTSGRYYWDLDPGFSSDWALGICKESWIGHKNEEVDPDGTFFLVCLKEGNHFHLLTTCPIRHHFLEKPRGLIGVLFDCEEGSLSFLDVAKSSLIYRYPPGTFNYPVRPYFSVSIV